MKALTSIAALTFCLLPSLCAANMITGTREYSATAYGLETDELLYVERHIETWKRGQLAERSVTYVDAEGRLIAEKEVRYGADPAAPSFEMTDFRIGLSESAEVGPDEVALASGDSDGGASPRRVRRPKGAVIDAGFDAFMRERFAEIAAGEPLEFEFAVPAARRFFKFELLPQGRVEYQGREALLVKMRPASLLLRLALDPIDLVYGLDGRLLEFRGLANVCDEDGDRYKARIVFDYGSKTASIATSSVGR